VTRHIQIISLVDGPLGAPHREARHALLPNPQPPTQSEDDPGGHACDRIGATGGERAQRLGRLLPWDPSALPIAGALYGGRWPAEDGENTGSGTAAVRALRVVPSLVERWSRPSGGTHLEVVPCCWRAAPRGRRLGRRSHSRPALRAPFSSTCRLSASAGHDLNPHVPTTPLSCAFVHRVGVQLVSEGGLEPPRPCGH